MPITPQDFVSKWKRADARERQSVQEHFIDLCALVGHETPMGQDPSGTRFAFEMGAAKTSGGSGWADVAKLGFFGWEYKGKDSDLDKAYEQLLRYRDALQNPPLLIVSDINNIIIRTNYTNLATRTITLTLDDLLTAEGLKTLKTVFFNPEQLKPQVTIESVTQEAAKQFSTLANVLRKFGEEPQEVAHFLIRLLFCLFAEDIGLLPEKLFPRLLEQTRRNSKDFAGVLSQLFRAMNTGGYFGSDKILHFNGGLFDDDHVLQLDSDAMDIIGEIDGLDWAAIKPSIFGTLFERGLDPSKRSQLGAHCTGEDDIILIVEPVLMAPLRREWEKIKDEVRKIKREEEKEVKGKKKTVLQKKIKDTLLAFADKIASIKVLDPACGSANFLYVALRLLLDLQNEVLNFSDEMGAGRPYITVTPAQLYGIETNEYAHELAQMTIQIGYIQWLRDNGYGAPAEPILKQTKNIMKMDAILAYDESGKPVEPEWPEADVIIGNPPFLGGNKIRAELGDKYVDALFKLYEGRVPAFADLVCYWFEKARAMIESGRAKRAGLLATNSIRGGVNRKVLERIKETGDIFWAQSNRDWVLDGAAVNVSMIGFDNGTEKSKSLDGTTIININSDLSHQSDVTTAKVLAENAGICFYGSQQKGSFDITSTQAKKLLSTPNPFGLNTSDVVKRSVNGLQILRGGEESWVIDFGVGMPMEKAAMYEAPFEYVKQVVYPERKDRSEKIQRDYWWLHARPSPRYREILKSQKRYIASPTTAKFRVFVWLDANVLADHAVAVFAREDDYFLGVLQSKIHVLWSLKLGTSLEDRPRYTPSTSFETFPFPWPPSQEPKKDPRVQAISQAAQELVKQRDRWLNAEGLSEAEKKKRTLTNLYNARPTWLELAHKRLDEAVFAAYGWKSDLSDEEILERLLALNLERGK
ncbi:MAG: N-6 DNA methylase [Anaerolineales bacterium]|nr:N-6 DNA methylase [Anaerolineales bacterium]